MMVDLTGIATDPSGDPITYRVVGDQHATATISADGTSLLFSPDDGYTGEATFTLVADDGFAQSALATIDVEVSSAPLVHIDFDQSRILFSAAGATDLIHVFADFADQTGVLVPLDYVNARIDNSAVATLTPDGLLTSIANGYTVLRAERGKVAAATVVGVGTPPDGEQEVANLYNINPYPASVTLIPAGATRSIITMLGTLPDTFVGPADGVKYISENTAIATVDANGIITAIADGFVDIKVLWTYGEGVVHVQVKEPTVGASVVVGTTGGIAQNADGISVGLGAGQVAADTTIAITSMTQDQLPLPMVGGDTGAFSFASAFTVDTSGSAVTGPVQLAAPVAGNANPGDKVYFFQKASLPTGPNGASQDWWSVVDEGVVDANGIAHSASPPLPRPHLPWPD
jgi:hypothetical protein